MKISQQQLTEAAQILFPKQWQRNQVGTIIDTLRWFKELGYNFEVDSEDSPKVKSPKIKRREPKARDSEIVELQNLLKSKKANISAAARAIGVTAVTIYSWLHGQTAPKPENRARIAAFVARTKP